MKTRVFRLLTALLVLSLCPALIFSSCGKTEVEDESEAVGDLSDEEIIELYRQAGYAYGWFEIYNMEFDRQDKKELEGLSYYKVHHEEIHNVESLQAYLAGFFVQDVIDELFSARADAPKFVDIEGELYTTSQVRPANRYAGEESFSIVRSQKGGLVNLLVDVEQLDKNMEVEGEQGYTFVLRQSEQGWLFENFALVR